MVKNKRGWFVAYHSGSLQECLETESRISKKTALNLIKMGVYKFYAFDDRINANRYLLCNMDSDFGLPTWLHDYDCEDKN